MVKINKHIEIVSSSDTTLSSLSQESRDAILATLSQYYTNVGITMVNTIADLRALVARQPDLVFLGMKFIPTSPHLGINDLEKIWLSTYLELHNITYTGSTQDAHELELNKPLSKLQIQNVGLPTSKFHVAKQHQLLETQDITLQYPVFIKPANRGGGLGIDSRSVAYDFASLHAKVQAITTDLGSDSLIEEYLPGREFSVAVLKNETDAGYAVMPIELVAEPDVHGARMLSGEVKSSNQEVVLEVTDPICRSQIIELALDVFHALGARDYGRIDIRMDSNNVPHFLEANLIPSLIKGYGSFPKACMLNQNLSYEPMILQIVNLAFSRETVLFDDRTEVDVVPHLVPVPAVFEIQPAL